MYIGTALFLVALGSILLIGLVGKFLNFNQQSSTALILGIIFIALWSYLFGIDRYKIYIFEKALTAEQHHQCGAFVETIYFNRSKKNQYETAYLFKLEHSQFIQFSGDAPVIAHLPELKYLDIGRAYCFRYATHVKDWNGRFILTALTPK